MTYYQSRLDEPVAIWIPAWLLRIEGIRVFDALLYCMIRRNMKHGQAFVGIRMADLAHELDCAISTISRSIARLKEAKLVEVQKGPGASAYACPVSAHDPTANPFCNSANADLNPFCSSANDAKGSSPNTPSSKEIQTLGLDTLWGVGGREGVGREGAGGLSHTDEKEDLESAFAKFCEVYPKRDGGCNKAKAKSVFEKLWKQGADREVLLGASRFRQHCDAKGKTGTEFIPMMTTWLNQHRWTEDYSECNTGNSIHETLTRLGVS